MNPNAPYIAHFRIGYEIVEKKASGEVSNWPVKDKVLHITVLGQNFEETLEKANTKFNKIKEFLETLND